MDLFRDAQAIHDDITQSTQTKYIGVAAFTILIWDHLSTLPVETECIWKRRKATISYLFILNRYLTPLGFIVNLFAYFSPIWTPERCADFIRFEGSMTLIGINVVALMMLLRIRILYYTQPYASRGVSILLAAQFGMNAYLLTRGEPVQHTPNSGVSSCTMIFDPDISVAAATSAWLPLLYDTVVFVLTALKTWSSVSWHKKRDFTTNSQFVARKLFEDGLLYFSVILSVTLVLTIMIIAAPPGLKNITAQLQLIITVTMMSRITLNLKSHAAPEATINLQMNGTNDDHYSSSQRQPGSLHFQVSGVTTQDSGMQLSTIDHDAWQPPRSWTPGDPESANPDERPIQTPPPAFASLSLRPMHNFKPR